MSDTENKSEARHTSGPAKWDAKVWDYDPDIDAPWLLGAEEKRILHGSIVASSEANARLVAAAYTSYDRHCGPRAVECAEGDLLGEAISALGELLRVNDEWHGSVNSEMASARNAARAVLAKVTAKGGRA